MTVRAAQRARTTIEALLHRGLDVPAFSHATVDALRPAVAFDGVCVLTIDPATLLPTSEVIENGLPDAALSRLTTIEITAPDFNKFAALARAPRPAATLHDATEGRLDRSLRHRELRAPIGLGDELRAVLVDDSETWGAVTLLRETGSAFTIAETDLLASLSGTLAEGLRRAVLTTALAADPESTEAGLLVLGTDDSIELANATAELWLDELRGNDAGRHELPLVVHAVVGRARHRTTSEPPPRARVLTRAGRWLLVRGSLVGEGPDVRVAVILEPAPAPQLAPLIAAAYGLTERERQVAQLVARGSSTNEIANQLLLSPYTVQDHLKSIFAKTDVGTRGELVARLFFEHYAPRMASGSPVGPSGWYA